MGSALGRCDRPGTVAQAHTPGRPRHAINCNWWSASPTAQQVNAPNQRSALRLSRRVRATLAALRRRRPGGHSAARQCEPRFYSLASGSDDGILEICVRKHQAACVPASSMTCDGRPIEAFIQPNPHFRPASGKATGDPDRRRYRYRAIGRFYPQQQGQAPDAPVLGWTPPGFGFSLRARAQRLSGGPTSDPVAVRRFPGAGPSYVQDG